MKLLLFLSCLMAAAKAGASQLCTGPLIGGVYYINKYLRGCPDIPAYLNYDKSTNSLYYVYDFSSRHVYKYDFGAKKSSILQSGVDRVYCMTIDSKTNDIFLGTIEGILKYNKNKNEFELYGANDTYIKQHYIKQLLSKDNTLYFNILNSTVNFDEGYVYKLADGEVSRLEDLRDTTVTSFIIDNDGYIVFANQSGVFRQKLGTKEAILYGTGKFVRGFAININGDVFAAASDGLYFVNKQKHTLDKYFAVDKCRSVTFDSENNIIYSDEHSIHKLEREDLEDCV